ncbi:MAG: hypothetical protein KGH72_03820 [Candidatus Micrarchaeota archaeon]|nr:hypothetical protein [Candidatus Micrarchaeota archaeon]
MRKQKEPKALDYFAAYQIWIKLFDPFTPQKVKTALVDLFRRDLEMPFDWSTYHGIESKELIEQIRHMQPNRTIGIVMTGGYPFGRRVVAAANELGHDPKVVLLGASVRNSMGPKKFRDRSAMGSEQLYVPKDHLEILCGNLSTPILLVDEPPDTGATLKKIALTLRGIGHTGEIRVITTNLSMGVMSLEECIEPRQNLFVVWARPLAILTEAS